MFRVIVRLVLIGCILYGAPQSFTLAQEQIQDGFEESSHDWLRQNAHALELESTGFDDLEFLRPLLKGKRIVQLGENTHGVREYSVLKARIVQFLHQELGFEVIAFESDIYQCYDANLLADRLPSFSMTEKSTMISSVIGVWHTEEVLPVFDYLRTARKGDCPLQLAGFDIQPIGNNKRNRPKFLASFIEPIDAEYAEEVLELDELFLKVYATGGKDRRTFFRGDQGQEMLNAYQKLTGFFRENADRIKTAMESASRESIVIARQTSASLATYIEKERATDTKSMYELRDGGMAKNLMAILDEAYPDKKIIVWGHNFHLRHKNEAIPANPDNFPDVAVRSMGSWLHDRYTQEIYTVGLYAYQGEAANNRGEVFQIAPAEGESLEGLFHSTNQKISLVDLSTAPNSKDTAWMDQPISARFNGTHPLQLVPREQYDAILYFDRVTPRKMLY